MMTAKLATAALLALAACSTAPTNAPEPRTTFAPHLGVVSTAPVGGVILRQGRASVVGIALDAPDNIGGRKLSPGFYPQTGEDERFTFHGFQTGKPVAGFGALSGIRDAYALRAAKDDQQLCVLRHSHGPMIGLKLCDTEHPYRRIERASLDAGDRSRTLSYVGRLADTLTLRLADGGGPPRTIRVDILKSAVVTVAGARLRILQAGDRGIRYVVLTGFADGPSNPDQRGAF